MQLYISELELSFTLNKDIFFAKVFGPKSVNQEFTITKRTRIFQKWLNKTPNSRSRIRKEEILYPSLSTQYTHTVKYFNPSDPTNRIEVNSQIMDREYDKINSYYPDIPTTEKLRITFIDIKEDCEYSMDIYPVKDPHSEYVAIEIEFPNEETKKDYNPPEWLAEALKLTSEAEKKGGQNGR